MPMKVMTYSDTDCLREKTDELFDNGYIINVLTHLIQESRAKALTPFKDCQSAEASIT